MEINLSTKGFGFPYNMAASFEWTHNDDGTISTSILADEKSAKDRIQEHLDAIKEVFLSADYDDKTMGYIVEDHIIAIQGILDAD
jgi:hypothetical protein